LSSSTAFVDYCLGAFSPGDDTNVAPPFQPDFIPPDSAFNSPTGQFDMLVTSYPIRTAVWAMDKDGEFDRTITPADVPPKSPIKLSTNDAFFISSVPGVKKFPNMGIYIQTSLYNISYVNIDTNGPYIVSTFELVFTLQNQTTQPGWTLLVDIGMLASLSVNMSSGVPTLYTTLGKWKSSVALVSSSLGDVYVSNFEYAVQLILALGVPQPSPVAINLPPALAVSNPFVNSYAGYLDVGFGTVTYTGPIPSITCPGNSQLCPEETTCCQWGGVWQCCTLPNANCCNDGCCPQSEQCCDGGCC